MYFNMQRFEPSRQYFAARVVEWKSSGVEDVATFPLLPIVLLEKITPFSIFKFAICSCYFNIVMIYLLQFQQINRAIRSRVDHPSKIFIYYLFFIVPTYLPSTSSPSIATYTYLVK